MFLIDQEDIVAIRRAFQSKGREVAVSELQRLWPWVPASAAPAVLEWLMAMAEEPETTQVEHDKRRPWWWQGYQ